MYIRPTTYGCCAFLQPFLQICLQIKFHKSSPQLKPPDLFTFAKLALSTALVKPATCVLDGSQAGLQSWRSGISYQLHDMVHPCEAGQLHLGTAGQLQSRFVGVGCHTGMLRKEWPSFSPKAVSTLSSQTFWFRLRRSRFTSGLQVPNRSVLLRLPKNSAKWSLSHWSRLHSLKSLNASRLR